MFNEFADALVWIIRVALVAGLAWGVWLCLGQLILPERSPRLLQLERFATFVVVVLLVGALGGLMQAV
jgi:hypothetical protein